jgi:hypothetical protein
MMSCGAARQIGVTVRAPDVSVKTFDNGRSVRLVVRLQA